MMERKVVLITGGAMGQGRSHALKFAENGADIAFLYAGNTAKAEETVKELEGLGVKAKAYQCNVADADAVAAVVKEIVKDFGGIQILEGLKLDGNLSSNGSDVEDWANRLLAAL